MRQTSEEFYWGNVTHNLREMAIAAGLYLPLWRPEELLAPEVAKQVAVAEKEFGMWHEETEKLRSEYPVVRARDLIKPLQKGLQILKADPPKFKHYNPSNGWGSYEGLVRFVQEYLDACKAHPDARVEVSR